MNQAQFTQGIVKALEVWTLQNLCDLAILAGFAVLTLVAGRAYLERLKARLTLRAASEVWEAGTDLLIDILLAAIALVALLLTNMDIMADIKIGLPFVPVAFVLMTAALVVRLYHGGSVVGSKAWVVTLALLAVACLANWFGFTFVMEGAGDEYLGLHPEAAGFWSGLEHLRSNKNPELAMATFRWTGPALLLLLGWAVLMGVVRTARWAQKSRMPAAPKSEQVPGGANDREQS
jgi:hypothetical protein